MAKDTTDTRARAITLLATGEATTAEVARLAKTTRQRVAYWAKVAKIKPTLARIRRLRELWRDGPDDGLTEISASKARDLYYGRRK